MPVYNEENVVSKKIQNIKELEYPRGKLEAVFVDGHSTDNTADVVEAHSKNHDGFIRLIREEQRGGYNSAICEGVLKSHGDIIVMSDAGAYFEPDGLKYLVGHFADPTVGAVTGKEMVLGDPGALGPRLETTYRGFYDFMRTAETQMDSTPDAKGEILAVRRKICENLTGKILLSPSASFDCCVPYQAKLEGYRTIFEPRAAYYEYAPSGFMDRMRQQVRRGAILMGSLLLFRNMMLNRKYGRFGVVIMPVHLLMQVVLPWLFALGFASLLVATVLSPASTVVVWALLLSIAALVSIKNRAFVLSFVQSQLALVVATLRVVSRRNSVIIDTIPSTRK
ncbi:MAG: glycosyltransferase [Candidatus Bathyarchaeota archaeon]|nr:MAG: glycosyltransferase [Candidatus Bathyarchaeota archaeon]